MDNNKKLYEICTGRIGFSYERSYVWADTDAEADRLFTGTNPGKEIRHKRVLFYASSPAFATKVNDEGFPESPV